MSTRSWRTRATEMAINDTVSRHFSNAHTLRGSPETQIKLSQLNAYNELFHDVLKDTSENLVKLETGEFWWLTPAQQEVAKRRLTIKVGDIIEDIETLEDHISELERESVMPKTHRTAKQRYMTKRSAIRSLRNKRSWKKILSPINE
jgi:hypothetical protein